MGIKFFAWTIAGTGSHVPFAPALDPTSYRQMVAVEIAVPVKELLRIERVTIRKSGAIEVQ